MGLRNLKVVRNQLKERVIDDTNYVLRIISDSPNSENKIEFICLSAINGYNISDQLNIFYDTALNAYHLKTEGPLLIDSEYQIKLINEKSKNIGFATANMNKKYKDFLSSKEYNMLYGSNVKISESFDKIKELLKTYG